MLVTVRNNDNTETNYGYEPAPGRKVQLEMFYSDLYKTLKIQGFAIFDNAGNVLAFRGSI